MYTIDQEFASKREFREAIEEGEVIHVITGSGCSLQGDGVLRVRASFWSARVRVEYGQVVSVLR